MQIIPSAEGISGKLSDILGRKASSAGNSAGQTAGSSLVSAITGVIANAGIGELLKKSLLEGANVEQSIGGIETLFKDSAEAVIESARNAYKTAGMSANEYMETVTSFSASLLQGLAGDTNAAAQVADMALTDMSDNANKMGTDMESIQNAYQGFAKQNYTMLDNLKLGYGGTKTEMQRLLADAQKLTGVKYDMNNLADVYSAIHAIQTEMDITGTTAKEASITFTGSLTAMKAAASNVLADLALGEDMTPSLESLKDTLFTFVEDNLFPMLQNIVFELPTIANAALDLLEAIVIEIGNMDSVAIISPFIEGIISGFGTLPMDLLNIASEIFNIVLDYLTWELPNLLTYGNEVVLSLVNGILEGIPTLIDSTSTLISQFLAFIMSNLPWVLESGVNLVLSLVQGIINSLPAISNSAVQSVDILLGTILDNAPSLIGGGLELVGKVVYGIIDNFPLIASSAISLVGNLLETVLKYAPDLLEGGFTLVGEIISGIINAVPDLLGKIPGIIEDIKEEFIDIDWKSVGKSIIDGIVRGITNAGSSIMQSAKEAAQSALRAAKEALGIHSPSRIFENEVGKMIDMGLAAGIENNVDSVSKSMKALSKATVGSIDTDFRTVFDTTAFENVTRQPSSVSVDDALDGVILQVINQVTVDGTPLKEKVSQYTINKLTSQQSANLKVKGAY